MGDLSVVGSVSLPRSAGIDLDGQSCVANKKGFKVDSYTCGDTSFEVTNHNLSFTLEPGSRLTIYDSNEKLYALLINANDPTASESTTPAAPASDYDVEYGRYGCP